MQIWANKCWEEEDNDFSQSPGCIMQSRGLVGLAAARRHRWPLQIPVPIWLHAALSAEQLSSFCGCKGLFFSRHWTLHFSLLNFNRFLLSYSSSLSRSLLMTPWLSIILTALPMLDVTCIFEQTCLQVIDKDVKCDWTQVLQLLPTTRQSKTYELLAPNHPTSFLPIWLSTHPNYNVLTSVRILWETVFKDLLKSRQIILTSRFIHKLSHLS